PSRPQSGETKPEVAFVTTLLSPASTKTATTGNPPTRSDAMTCCRLARLRTKHIPGSLRRPRNPRAQADRRHAKTATVEVLATVTWPFREFLPNKNKFSSLLAPKSCFTGARLDQKTRRQLQECPPRQRHLPAISNSGADDCFRCQPRPAELGA